MNGGHFGVHQDQNFCKLDYHFLMKVARHVQSNQKRKFIKFLQYIKKKYRNCFCVLLWCKTFRCFTGFQHICCYLFLGGCGQKWAQPSRSWNYEICCISTEWIGKMSCFFACWYKFRISNVNLIIIGWTWSKMGKPLDHMGL